MNPDIFAAYPTEVIGGTLSLADLIRPSGVDPESVPAWLYREIADEHDEHIASVLAPYNASLTCDSRLMWRCPSPAEASALQVDIASGAIPSLVRAFDVMYVQSVVDWIALNS